MSTSIILDNPKNPRCRLGVFLPIEIRSTYLPPKSIMEREVLIECTVEIYGLLDDFNAYQAEINEISYWHPLMPVTMQKGSPIDIPYPYSNEVTNWLTDIQNKAILVAWDRITELLKDEEWKYRLREKERLWKMAQYIEDRLREKEPEKCYKENWDKR